MGEPSARRTGLQVRAALWVVLLAVLLGAAAVARDRSPADETAGDAGSPRPGQGTRPAASATPPTGAPSTEPGSTRTARQYPMVGVQFQGTWSTYTDAERRTLLDDLVAMGVKSVRIGISWAMIQPRPPSDGAGGWSWSWGIPRVDSVIAMARARGLIVHATFGRTPAWANDDAGEGAAPTSLADWQRAVAFVAHRYRGQVTSWEIWNEPNLPKYFPGGTAATYTRLLCAAYPIIKRQSPRTPVVFGGLDGNDWQFLRAAFQAGANGCFDVLAVHPYQRWGFAPGAAPPNDEPWYFGNVVLIRRVQRRFHDLVPIWFTELGWSTHPNSPSLPEYERGVSEHRQAAYLVRTLELTRQRYPYVARVYVYEARDETGFGIDNDNFGLFTLSLSPKPAVTALRQYLGTG
jgi:hypothetical protein